MSEQLAAAVHQAYLDTCARLGWSVKPENAVPYQELPEDAKELDRASVRAATEPLSLVLTQVVEALEPHVATIAPSGHYRFCNLCGGAGDWGDGDSPGPIAHESTCALAAAREPAESGRKLLEHYAVLDALVDMQYQREMETFRRWHVLLTEREELLERIRRYEALLKEMAERDGTWDDRVYNAARDVLKGAGR